MEFVSDTPLNMNRLFESIRFTYKDETRKYCWKIVNEIFWPNIFFAWMIRIRFELSPSD